jgi:hypothetical protein
VPRQRPDFRCTTCNVRIDVPDGCKPVKVCSANCRRAARARGLALTIREAYGR